LYIPGEVDDLNQGFSTCGPWPTSGPRRNFDGPQPGVIEIK